MRRTLKLAAIFVLAVCLMGTFTFSAVAAGTPQTVSAAAVSDRETDEPRRWEPHCGTPNQTGVLVISQTTSQIGSQVRACVHGRLGHVEHRYQYQSYTIYDCTLCAFYSKISNGAPYWGEWIC